MVALLADQMAAIIEDIIRTTQQGCCRKLLQDWASHVICRPGGAKRGDQIPAGPNPAHPEAAPKALAHRAERNDMSCLIEGSETDGSRNVEPQVDHRFIDDQVATVAGRDLGHASTAF